MPPPESIMISDDEPDPQQTLSRDMEALDEKVNEVNKMVVELGVEVSSYAKLLKAAQSRLDRARQQKEHLVDEKHRLLDKKQKLMQLSASHKLPRPLAYGLNHVKSNNVNGHIEPGNEPKPKSPAQSIPTPQPHDQLAHSLTPVAANAGKRPRLGYFGQPPITKPFSSSEGDSEEFPSIRKRATNPRGGRGRRPRRLYGGLNGVRASISSRALRTPSEEKEKSHRTRNVRAHVYRQNGGVYVGDWLRKEVGKTYQIFKKTSNNWLYYGKYIISSIQGVSLAEWREFEDVDKNRWSEHMLEHQWGKNILLKKRLLTEEQCIKSNWEKVLGFFNRTDNHPNLRLKVLALHFLSYDIALYDALSSIQLKSSLAEGKRRYSDYDEDENDSNN